jgi:hypothetical protein
MKNNGIDIIKKEAQKLKGNGICKGSCKLNGIYFK